MKIFLDANVLVTVLNKEYPLFSDAARVLSLSDKSGFQLFTSPICLAIAFYFAEKKSGAAVAKQKIKMLTDHILIAPTNAAAVQQAINNQQVLDFEDGLEYYSAVGSGCQVIVTEDKDDFYFAELPVMNCAEFLRSDLFKTYTPS